MTRTTLERAFELAKSGKFSSLETLRAQLVAEKYADVRTQTSGPALTKQLRDLMKKAAGHYDNPKRPHPSE